MKYIDADKLIKAIEEKGLNCSFALKMERLDTLALIDSLQQEQPSEDLEAETQMQWDSFNHNLAEYGDDQEEVVWLNWNSFKDVCRDLYELGFNAGEVYQRGHEQAEQNIVSLIESRIAEILGDAQPAPVLRAELRELIERIKEEEHLFDE